MTFDILLILAFLGTALCSYAVSQPSGPEKVPVGAWLLFVLPAGLVAGLLIACIVRGRVDWLLPNRAASFGLLVGVLGLLVMSFFASLDRHLSGWRAAAYAGPYLIMAGCLLLLHPALVGSQRAAGIGLAATLGSAALAGWLWIGVLFFESQKEKPDAVAAAREMFDRADAAAAAQREKFSSLPSDAGFVQLTDYMFADDSTLAGQARERIAALPDLDDQLAACFQQPCADRAVLYVARLDQTPSPRLAAPFAAFLDRQLAAFPERLKSDPYIQNYSSDLYNWFEAAGKIQGAGGDLRPQLLAWQTALKPVKGLESPASYLDELIR